MPGVSFQFSAKDNSAKVFKSFNKQLKDLNKSLKMVQNTMKTMGNIVTMVLHAVGTVVKTVVNLAVNIIKKGISTIKNLITGAFKFVKSALTTLLSWMKKALGTVFDWIGKTVTTISKTAVNTAKKAISGIVKSIQAYADKEYNSIQLKVSLGSDYSRVQKSFDELVRMTTADRNDLWSVFATYAEVGKSAKEISKYARATVYLANATGLSLDRITRIFLAQEAVTKNVEKTLYKYGINIKNAKADLSDIEKIIVTMDEEMQALASDSLSQTFANVKNDLIGIKESLGALFARPVKYVADKLDALLQKILGSNKISGLIDKLNPWFDKVEDFVDKVFDKFERILSDPEGFITALWSDIQTLFSNIWDNLGYYFKLIGQTLGMSISYLIDWLKTADFSGFTSAISNLSTSLQDFVIGLGQGLHWWAEEDVVEGSLKQTFINAWNKAHPDFTLDASDKWYKNLSTLLDGLWNDILKPIWTEHIKPLLDDVIEWVKGPFATVMGTIFSWLGEVIGTALNNALVSSDVVRGILNYIPGFNFASSEEAAEVRNRLYNNVKDYLPAGWTAADLTKENLLNAKGPKGNTSLMHWLFGLGGQTATDIAWLRKYTILEEKQTPTLRDLADAIEAALKPAGDLADKMGPLTDALKDFRENAENYTPPKHWQTQGFTMTGMGTGSGSGGIQDYLSNEFKIRPYSDGGPVLKPTLALIGEDGPEFVLSNDMLKAMKRTTGGGGINSIPGWHLDDTGKWVENDLWYDIGKLWEGAGKTMTEGVDNLKNFFKSSDTSPKGRTTGGGGINNPAGMFLDRNGVWKNDDWLNRSLDRMAGYIEDILKEGRQDGWHVALTHITADAEVELFKGLAKFTGLGMKGLGFIAGQGGFGSHLGNIYSNSFDEDGAFSWLKMFGAIIQEFLPYLQKGLELVGGIFDKAFDILGNAVMKLGEEISTTLLPLLESFIPFMKVLADIVTSLAPVVSSVLAPAIYVICAVLQVLTGLLDWLMPAFAGIGAVIQWVSDAITWAIGSFINWLASWIPWIDGVGEVHRPDSIKGYYNSIMGAYNDAKNTGVNASMAAAQTASQTVSYSGATHITINNDFAGSYIVGSDGMSELALIMANQLDNMGYLKVNIA